MLRVPKRTPTTEIHAELNMFTLSQRRTLHVAKQMFYIENELCPNPVLKRFPRRSELSSKSTRAVTGRNFELPKYRLQQSRRNFVYRGIKVWEMLPVFTKASDEVQPFVSNVKRWLIDGDVGIT